MIIVFLILLAAVLIWTLWGNTALVTSQYTVPSSNIPEAFDGYRIVQVSDLHNAKFGADNEKLLRLLSSAQPDMIAITGDLLDARTTDFETAVAFAREAVKIAPVYYVPGNHESRIPSHYAQLKIALTELGAVVLENESMLLEKSGAVITLTGLLDPNFGISWPDLSTENYQIVLSHRPELLDTYAERSFNLVLTGHAHGGQIRIPFVGGLVAPDQGWFPGKDCGLYYSKDGEKVMILSRGLGSKGRAPRVNNVPEIVVVELLPE